jgi:hypothetical protein
MHRNRETRGSGFCYVDSQGVGFTRQEWSA